MYYVVQNDVVYRKEILEDGCEVLVAVLMTKKILIISKTTTTVNTPIPISVVYFDWQDNPLPDENRPIRVVVTGPGQAQELILIPTNGQAEFDFVSEVPGTFKIQATAEFPCDSAEIEVVVS